MGVEARSAERERVKHQLLHAGDRLLQQQLAALQPEPVGAIISGDTDVNMQPAAGLAHKRLRHEGGLHPERLRDTLHDPLEKHGMVRGLHGIGDVAQIHLVLPDAVFGDRATHGHALVRGSGCHAIEKDRALLDCIHR